MKMCREMVEEYLPMMNNDPHRDIKLKMIAGQFNQKTSFAVKGGNPCPG